MVTENKLIEALAEALAPVLRGEKGLKYGQKHDASGTPIATGYSHGPGGLLTFPGVDPDHFSTTVGNIGLMSELATKASVFTNPVFQIITGVQDISGAEKSDVCDNAPIAGLIKACKHNAPFGRYELATPEIELNRLGQFNDRADPMDIRLVNSPIAQSGLFATGPSDPTVPGNILIQEVARKFWELGIAFHRKLSIQLWRGNPVNNAAGGGYKEFPGLDLLINTGYVDAETNTSCPSVDSDLKDMNHEKIDDGSANLIAMLSYLFRTRRDLAFRTGMLPVRWALAMRPELFWEITAIWPCNYMTYRCNMLGSDARLTYDAADAVRMRDDMRENSYLMIDGYQLDVLLDDGIVEDSPTTSANVSEGCVESSIYLIPISVIGGQAVTYLEYADYGNPSLRQALGDNLILARAEGAFLTWPRQTNQCIQWQSKIEPRVVLRTPWLAGKIQHIQYCPAQHTRSPFPTDDYFVDGGVTSRQGPSYYSLWQS
jgi:hypothetical protein